MSRTQDWSAADEATIRKMFAADCSDCAMAERLGRTLKAVEGRRTRMGLYRVRQSDYVTRASVRGRAWTAEETEMLISAVNMDWSNERIGELLNRTAQSIKGKREVLLSGVQRRNASAVASIEASSGWPRANAVERARGERLLNMAFGGKPRVDRSPMTRQWQPPKVATQTIGASSCAWAVA